jgi:ferredoxin-NADP reductase
MAMLRHRRRALPQAPMRLVYSVRGAGDVIYAGELSGDPDVVITYTRAAPEGWSGHTGRIDAALIAAAAAGAMTAYVCGSNGFVESATALLLAAGLAPEWIRTERFGPTG